MPGATTAESKEKFATILAAIETNRVPLAALWVFDFASQAKDWSVTATNGRSWQLDAIQQANERMRASPVKSGKASTGRSWPDCAAISAKNS